MRAAPGQVYWSRAAPEVLAALDSAATGLSGRAARERLAKTGPNAVADRSELPAYRLLLKQFENPLVRMHGNPMPGLMKARHGMPPQDVDAKDFRAPGQHGFELFHFRQQMGGRRTRQAIGPSSGVDVVVVKGDAGEMSRLPAWPLPNMLMRSLDALVGLQFMQQSAPVKGLGRGRREAAYPEGHPFQR